MRERARGSGDQHRGCASLCSARGIVRAITATAGSQQCSGKQEQSKATDEAEDPLPPSATPPADALDKETPQEPQGGNRKKHGVESASLISADDSSMHVR
jgi:hypothetical protein